MNSFQLDSLDFVILDGKTTQIRVVQHSAHTGVYVLNGEEIKMPSPRYALSTDRPASGVPGRAAFERDLRAAIARASVE